MKPFGSDDIRGIYPEQVNEDFAYNLGRSMVEFLSAKKIVVGNDIRLSGPALKAALIRGICDAGCDVVDIGRCGTEMIYFATTHLNMDGGIMITASHNPKEYNGFKLVRSQSRPISKSTGLRDIEELCRNYSVNNFDSINNKGKVSTHNIMPEYLKHVLSYVDVNNMKPLRVVANTGNGAAGPIINELEKHLPFDFVKVYNEPDGNFPNGVPNPILQENRASTSNAVREHGADVGIAWDGDFDRCFLFDEQGNMVEGYYMVGFLAEAFLHKYPGARIIHDPRVYWNTQEICAENSGKAVFCRSGHAHIKDKMREVDAVYGSEMSAHHYFRDFSYCDSGMIPWLLVLELLSIADKPLSAMMKDRLEKYPCSGELNTKVADTETASGIMEKLEKKYSNLPDAVVTHIDGLGVEFPGWRFNLRKSNTEPVLRLNIETRQDRALLEEKIAEINEVIRLGV